MSCWNLTARPSLEAPTTTTSFGCISASSCFTSELQRSRMALNLSAFAVYVARKKLGALRASCCCYSCPRRGHRCQLQPLLRNLPLAPSFTPRVLGLALFLLAQAAELVSKLHPLGYIPVFQSNMDAPVMTVSSSQFAQV